MGALALSTVLPASPPFTALKTTSGSSPALVASTSASPMAAMLHATIIWLASLVTLPAPTAPVRVALEPSDWNNGRTASKMACSAADHDGQCAVDGLGLAATDWRVEEFDPLPCASRADFLRDQGADGAHVDDDGAGLGAFENSCRAEDRGIDIRSVRQHGDGHL